MRGYQPLLIDHATDASGFRECVQATASTGFVAVAQTFHEIGPRLQFREFACSCGNLSGLDRLLKIRMRTAGSASERVN